MQKLQQIFKVKKPVIGMLHLDYLAGAKEFKGNKFVVMKALNDLEALEGGGVDGILVENWKEDSIGEFVSPETATSFSEIAGQISKYLHLPFGINVLNNDYKVAFSVAKQTGASFVQLDVFVDKVRSNYVHSPLASKTPFDIDIDPKEIMNYAKSIRAETIPLFVFVQPKHYVMLEKNKTIETSVRQAIKAGASALLVTKATGLAPTLDLVNRAKNAAGDTPVGIGSGFSVENAEVFLKIADFAVVGTSIKVDRITDNPVDLKKVKELMGQVKRLRF